MKLGLGQKVVRSGVDTYLDQLRVDPLESEQILDDAFEPQRPVLRADEGTHDEGNEGFAGVARGFGGWEGVWVNDEGWKKISKCKSTLSSHALCLVV